MARAARWVYEGVRELRGVSPQLDTLIDRHGAPPWGRPIPVADRFPTLARGIAYQQLAGAAARSAIRLPDGEGYKKRAPRDRGFDRLLQERVDPH